MHGSVSPRSYRAALLEQFTANKNSSSSISYNPMTSSSQRRRQQCDSVVIENSSLLGKYGDLLDTTAATITTSAYGGLRRASHPNSRVIEFIDHCVAKGVPESLIVEHVMFMVNAMQEQISMNEALHARYQYDRLRQYEMLELKKTLERQRVFYDQQPKQQQQQGPQALYRHNSLENIDATRSQRRRGHTPSGRDVWHSTSAPAVTATDSAASGVAHGGGGAYVRGKAEPMVAAVVHSRATGRSLRPPSSSERNAQAVFTQTPRVDSEKLASSRPRATTASTFHRFMRPTDASYRKERQKRTSVTEEEEQHQQQQKQKQRPKHQQLLPTDAARRSQTRGPVSNKDAAAWRGRQRLLGETGISVVESSTWSDDDSPLPRIRHWRSPGSTEDAGPQQRREEQQEEEEEEERVTTVVVKTAGSSQPFSPLPTEKTPSNDATAVTAVYPVEKVETMTAWQSGAQYKAAGVASAPVMSVQAPSYVPSPQLQAYIEQSQRKVREAERLLSNTPGRTGSSIQRVRRSATRSPLSDVLSELSDE
ncbi:hypothetical protein DQ04_02511040 [Trypanosoma grayi]|uniref:hypothetical protein n=1 Tax=Trypanosoma grayi TaxID=71804 RepID=UPI0004F438FA|nr:hypothetical protein DQ04_02511040 [Trypanosoma grayi]KEG11545.1 hypothetical protein DQ04_02511040 [Trypanosoma grayi]